MVLGRVNAMHCDLVSVDGGYLVVKSCSLQACLYPYRQQYEQHTPVACMFSNSLTFLVKALVTRGLGDRVQHVKSHYMFKAFKQHMSLVQQRCSLLSCRYCN